jgi:hypothetical protein
MLFSRSLAAGGGGDEEGVRIQQPLYLAEAGTGQPLLTEGHSSL